MDSYRSDGRKGGYASPLAALFAGAVLGAAAAWFLRHRNEGGTWTRAGHSGGDWLSDHEPETGPMEADEKVEDMLEDSFPASDPPSYTVTRAGKPHGT